MVIADRRPQVRDRDMPPRWTASPSGWHRQQRRPRGVVQRRDAIAARGVVLQGSTRTCCPGPSPFQ